MTTTQSTPTAADITCACPRCGKTINIAAARQQGSCMACITATYGTAERDALYANRANIRTFAVLA